MALFSSSVANKTRLGRILSSLSHDPRAFAAGCLAISAVIFVILELFFHPTPSLTSFVSLLASILMAWIIHASTRRAHQRLMRRVSGKLTMGDGLDGNVIGRWRSHLNVSTLAYVVPPLVIGGTLVMSVVARFDVDRIFNARASMLMHVVPILVLVFVAFVLVEVLRWHRTLRSLNIPIATIALLVSVLVNAIVVHVAPAADVWYYVGDIVCIVVGDIVCIVGLLASSMAFLRLYDMFLTSQLTKPSDRKDV